MRRPATPVTRIDSSSDQSASALYRTGRPIVIQMHGVPGSGKSTVARALALRLKAIVLDKDIIKSALLRAGVSEESAGPMSYEVFFDQAREFAAAGYSIVLDNPVFWESVERRWLETAALANSAPFLIECVCSDRVELVRRLEMREALASQPCEPLDLLQHPGSAETQFKPRLVLDTTRSLDDLVDEAIAWLGVEAPA